LQVSEIMTDQIHACHPEDSLNAAATIMGEHDCGAVPILDGRQELVGMLTDRDICLCAAKRDEPLSSLQVSDAVSWEPLTCSPDEEIETAEKKLAQHQVRRLPVTDHAGRLLGMLSLADIARAQRRGPARSQRKVATTIAAISKPTEASRIHG